MLIKSNFILNKVILFLKKVMMRQKMKQGCCNTYGTTVTIFLVFFGFGISFWYFSGVWVSVFLRFVIAPSDPIQI